MRAIISISFGLVATAAFSADNPPPTLSSRLPDGAVARIGVPEQRVRNEVHTLAYSPDGKRIAVSVGYHVQILDAETGVEIKMLSKQDWRSLIREVRFTADGKWLICQGVGTYQSPESAILWNLTDWKESGRMLKTERHVMALSPDGKLLAALDREGRKSETRYQFVLWDALSGAELRTIPTEGLEGILSLRFSADGKRLLAKQERGGWKTLEAGRIGNPSCKRWVTELKEPPPYGSAYDTRLLSPDGGLFIHAHSQGVGSTSYWSAYDTATGKVIERFDKRNGRFIGFDDDGQRFLDCIASYDHSLLAPLPDLPGVFALKKMMSGAFGFLRLCETATGKVLQQWIVPMEEVRATAFGPDGKSLLVGLSYSLRKLELRTGDIAPRLGWWRYRSTDLRYSRDGRALFVWEIDGRARTICDPATGMVMGHLRSDVAMDVGTLKRPAEMMRLKDGRFEPTMQTWSGLPQSPRPQSVYSVIRSPDSKHLVAFAQVQTGYSPGSGYVHYGPGMPVELWQTKPLKKIATSASEMAEPMPIKHIALEGLGFGGPRAHSIGFSPDGGLYAWNDTRGMIHVWEVPSGRKLPPLKLEGANGAGAFSRDRRLLAISGKDDLQVFEIASGSVRLKLGEKMSPASGITFSADGSRIASSHYDTSTLIWNALAGPERGKGPDAKCWSALGDASAASAVPAMQQLLADPDASIPFLREKLLVHVVPDPHKRIQELIEQLKDDTFRVRRDAELELLRIGRPALAALEKAGKSLSEDLSMRARKVIEGIQARYPAPSVERMQAMRGVEVLERIANAEARVALRELAAKAVDADIRRDAQESLERLTAER